MSTSVRSTLAVLAAGLWVNVSEFIRNEFLFKSLWVEHYQSLGLTFPSAPMNGLVWIIWGFLFALAVFHLSRKLDLTQTALTAWQFAFTLMWLILWNLGVLPNMLLLYAIPLSLLEAFVAAWICLRIAPN